MTSRKSTTKRQRLKRAIGVGTLLSVTLLCACEAFDAWDNAFRKRYWGWMTGDGGATVKIGSHCSGSLATPTHGDGQSYSSTRVFSDILGNTIALHSLEATPSDPPTNNDTVWNSSSQEIRYYGRSWPTGGNPPAVKDITYTETIAGAGPLGLSNTGQFFGSGCSDIGGVIVARRWHLSVEQAGVF